MLAPAERLSLQGKRPRSEPRFATGCRVPLFRFLIQEAGGEAEEYAKIFGFLRGKRIEQGQRLRSFALVKEIESASALRGIALNVLRRGVCSSVQNKHSEDREREETM